MFPFTPLLKTDPHVWELSVRTNASFICALLGFTQTSQITETYSCKSHTRFLKILIIFSRHFSKMPHTRFFLLKQRLLISISWSCSQCLHLLSGYSDSSFSDKARLSRLSLSGCLVSNSLTVFLLLGHFHVWLWALGSYQTTSLAGCVLENSQRGPQQRQRGRCWAEQRQASVGVGCLGNQGCLGLLNWMFLSCKTDGERYHGNSSFRGSHHTLKP